MIPRSIFLALLLVSTAAAAGVSLDESAKNADYEKPASYAYDAGRCHEYMVKALYAATDINQDLEHQEKLLNAAEAYRLLSQAGQEC